MISSQRRARTFLEFVVAGLTDAVRFVVKILERCLVVGAEETHHLVTKIINKSFVNVATIMT